MNMYELGVIGVHILKIQVAYCQNGESWVGSNGGHQHVLFNSKFKSKYITFTFIVLKIMIS